MIDLLAGSILLSIIHAAIPNHWIPVVMIGRAEKWCFRTGFYMTSKMTIIEPQE
jgi:hypothetical protein